MGQVEMREAFGRKLVELGRQEPRLVVLTADVSRAVKTDYFAENFPRRFFNLGVAEQNMLGVAAGFALAGYIPVASTFAVFGAGRAFDQIRNTIAYARLNVKIICGHAGVSAGKDGGSHQSIEDIALMRSLPGMVVLSPCDAIETEAALAFAIGHEGPVYMRVSRAPVPDVNPQDYQFRFPHATWLRQGKDIAIVATGSMVSLALEAAQALATAGINTAVLNVSTLKPVDTEAILSAAGCGGLLTVEEHSVIGGLGSLVAEVLAGTRPTLLKRIGLPDEFGQSGSPGELLTFYGLTAASIIQEARQLMTRKREARR